MGLGASGALYVGVNLEFAALPLYNSVHAEQFLVVNALHHGERDIRRIAVSAVGGRVREAGGAGRRKALPCVSWV